MFRDSNSRPLREFGTPERVFAVARYLLDGPKTRNELKEGLSMSAIMGHIDENAFSYPLSYAQDLELIALRDGKYYLSVPKELVASINDFRFYTARTALSRTDSPFFRITSAVLSLNEALLLCRNLSELAQAVIQQGVEVSEYNMRGWRFWAFFFGLGYIHKFQFVPNAFIRIRDALCQQQSLPIGEMIDVQTFFSWLETSCPELVSSRKDNRIGLAVSNGLRVLHNTGAVTLVNQPDAGKWKLYQFAAESLNDISHVRISGGLS